MSDAQKQKMRMHYKELFLDYDPRENLSELLQDGINRDPQLPDIKKSSRIDMKDVQIGQTTNKITFISKAVMRLKNLQQFYIANSPIKQRIFARSGKMPIPNMPGRTKQKAVHGSGEILRN
mgnify:CR=1 FL=1